MTITCGVGATNPVEIPEQNDRVKAIEIEIQ
jgi:hypothetical protein